MGIPLARVTLDDIEALQSVSITTFYDTFSSQNTVEDMEAFLSGSFNIEKLTAELLHPYSTFYFAKIDNKIAGYLKVNTSTAQTELHDSDSLEIERIYVINEFQGKKIGQILFDKAIEIGKAQSLKYIWLGVWEKNEKAIRFYEKNGLVKFDTHIFKLGSDVQTDVMMKLVLR